ncbi:MAG: class I SAM-dependent methyltransferase [bacterium]|nr:class I SAM-dependent methyltransferase [bacterium]
MKSIYTLNPIVRIFKVINTLLTKLCGLQLIPAMQRNEQFSAFQPIYKKCKPYTMTSAERMYALHKATQYVVHAHIEGDIVETGVWRGGSSMVIAHTLIENMSKERDLYLYDTFSGMEKPSTHDRNQYSHKSPLREWKFHNRTSHNNWCYSTKDDVRSNMASTGYPEEHILLIEGKVEDTIPQQIPEKISLLRLDTDWYASTAHEMQHLFPRLSKGGVLFIDDYNYWDGCRKAVDEYLQENGITLLLLGVDAWGAVGIKS